MSHKLKTAFLAATTWAGVALNPAAAAPLAEVAPITVELNVAGGESALSATLADLGFTSEAVAALAETGRHVDRISGRTYLTFEQRVLGTPVHASTLRVTIEKNGTISRVVHRLANLRELRGQLPRLADSRALARAVGAPFGQTAPALKAQDARGAVFDKGAFYQQDPTASAVFLADEDGTLAPGSLVEAWSKEGNRLVQSLVAASGQVVATEERTSQDSYVAFAKSPLYGNAQVMHGSAADGRASPRGWLDTGLAQYTDYIRGNNVHAYADENKDNLPDRKGTRVTNGNFSTVPNTSQDAGASVNERGAAQSLFYHVNVIHDRLYKAGFTETAGNFQKDNFGRGGMANDPVMAEAIDGSGTNNANFATPSWGSPRMQMFKWTRTSTHRNGSYDADIMWHEYGHGVIQRMVGDLDWPISWAVNEGWADSIAVVGTADDRLGEWANNRTAGIRRRRYEGYPYTLADYKPGRNNRHANGEILGAAVWKLRTLFKGAGRSDDQLMHLMVEGLANTSPRPTYIDIRNGMLAVGDDAQDCLVWKAFAAFGMGEGASISWSGSTSSPSISKTVRTALPSKCSGGGSGGSTTASTVEASLNIEARTGNPGYWWAPTEVKLKKNGQLAPNAKVVLAWSAGRNRQTGCTTDSSGTCDARNGGFPESLSTVTATIVSVDGRSYDGPNKTYTLNNPYGSGGSTTASTVEASLDIEAQTGRTGYWWAPTKARVKKNGQLASNAKVVVAWSAGRDGETSCTTDSSGTCDARTGGFLQSLSRVTATIVSVDGRPYDGPNKTYTLDNPYGSGGSTSTVEASLDIEARVGRTGYWWAPTTVLVKKNGQFASNAKVVLAWSAGRDGKTGCTTDSSGRCDARTGGFLQSLSTVTATILSVDGRSYDGPNKTYTLRNPY